MNKSEQQSRTKTTTFTEQFQIITIDHQITTYQLSAKQDNAINQTNCHVLTKLTVTHHNFYLTRKLSSLGNKQWQFILKKQEVTSPKIKAHNWVTRRQNNTLTNIITIPGYTRNHVSC